MISQNLKYISYQIFTISFVIIVSCDSLNTTDSPSVNVTASSLSVNLTEIKVEITKTTPGIVLTAVTQAPQANVGNSTDNTTLLEPDLPPQKPPPALGLPCLNSSECKANNSNCQDGVCSCDKGYITSLQLLRCLKVATKFDDECSEDVQCTEGLNENFGPTTCLNFRCSCGIGMSLIEGKCQGQKVLNSNCSSDDDCTIMKSLCIEGQCRCNSGFVPNSEDTLCLPVNVQLQQLSGPLSSCTEDVQCQNSMGDLAICVIELTGGTCECKPGTHSVKNKCMKFKELGEECSFDEECISIDVNTENPSSRICNGGQCKCNFGWVQIDNICKGSASQNSLAVSVISLVILTWIFQKP